MSAGDDTNKYKEEEEWAVEGGFSLEMRDLYIYHEFLVFGYDGDEEWKI